MMERWSIRFWMPGPKTENSSPLHQAFRLLIDSHAHARVKPSAKVCEKN